MVVAESDDPNTQAMLEGVAGGFAQNLAQQRAAIEAAVAVALQYDVTPDPAALQAAITDVLAGDAAAGAPAVSVETEQAGDVEPVASVNYVLTGYLAMFLFFAAGFGAAELLRERTNGTLDRLIASGVSPGTLLAGKWLGTAARGVLQAAVLWTFGILFFNIDLGNDPLGVMLVTLGMLVASASFTLFLASVAKTERASESITILASLTLAALGGSWWPLFITPEWMQTLAKITPHAWANEAFNKLMVFGATTADIWLNLVVLLAFGVVFSALAVYRLRLRD
jgi:ABC-type multidrug transport system permease subunit